jgi:hypothetical protein
MTRASTRRRTDPREPHGYPGHTSLRKELLTEAESLWWEVRDEFTRLRGRVSELETEVEHRKSRYLSAIQAVRCCENAIACQGRCPLLIERVLSPRR